MMTSSAVSVTCRTGDGLHQVRVQRPSHDALRRTCKGVLAHASELLASTCSRRVPPRDALTPAPRRLVPPSDAPGRPRRGMPWPRPPVLLALPPGAPGPAPALRHTWAPPSAGPLGHLRSAGSAEHGCPQVGHRADSAPAPSMFWAATRPCGARGREPAQGLATLYCLPAPSRPPGTPLICGAGTGSAHPCLPMMGCRGHAGAQSWLIDVQCLEWVRKGPASRATPCQV